MVMKAVRGNWTLVAVVILLVAQVVLFWVSLDTIMAISMFCTVTTGSSPPIFGYVHLAYLFLFLVGLASLFWQRARLPYVAAISIALLALPMQVWMLENDKLRCEGP